MGRASLVDRLGKQADKLASGKLSGIQLQIRAGKLVFLDSPMLSLMDRYRIALFTKIGKEIRRSANRSMIDVRDKRFKGKKNVPPSKPGKPPRARVGYLKKFNYYAWDNDSMVVGPILLPGNKAPIPAPGLHEKGGVTSVPHWGANGTRVLFPARPFMNPAMKRTLARVDRGNIKP